jgi:hypothetical protein
MRKATLLVIVFSLALLSGCGKSGEQQAQQPQGTPPEQAPAQQVATPAQPAPAQQAPAPAPQPAGTAQRAAAPQPAAPAGRPATATTAAPAQPAAPAAIQPAEPPKPKVAVLGSGTSLPIRLSQALDSGKNKTGEKFEATLDQDLVVDGQTVAPRGSAVVGKLVGVEGSGRVEGLAKMSLALTEIRVGSESYPISTNTLSFQAESTKKKDAAKVGIGAGVGAVIGAIAGGGKGAAIGAAVGGGAGTATVLATKGKEVTFEPEQKLTFTLKQDLQVTLK